MTPTWRSSSTGASPSAARPRPRTDRTAARCATGAARACRGSSRRSKRAGRIRAGVHVDGGARGNPGPAAAAAVVSDASDGTVLDEATELLGETTNNAPEDRGLVLGLARARALGATEVEVVNDSELVAKQVNGEYKVKHAAMKALHAEALAALRRSTRGRSARCRAPRTPTPTRSSTRRSTPRAEHESPRLLRTPRGPGRRRRRRPPRRRPRARRARRGRRSRGGSRDARCRRLRSA